MHKIESRPYEYYVNNLILSDYEDARNVLNFSDEITKSTINKIPSDITLYAKWELNE